MDNKIKYYRNLYNLTQQDLANKCNISIRHLQNIEYNKVVPTIYLAYKIKNALNVNYIEDIFIIDD